MDSSGQLFSGQSLTATVAGTELGTQNQASSENLADTVPAARSEAFSKYLEPPPQAEKSSAQSTESGTIHRGIVPLAIDKSFTAPFGVTAESGNELQSLGGFLPGLIARPIEAWPIKAENTASLISVKAVLLPEADGLVVMDESTETASEAISIPWQLVPQMVWPALSGSAVAAEKIIAQPGVSSSSSTAEQLMQGLNLTSRSSVSAEVVKESVAMATTFLAQAPQLQGDKVNISANGVTNGALTDKLFDLAKPMVTKLSTDTIEQHIGQLAQKMDAAQINPSSINPMTPLPLGTGYQQVTGNSHLQTAIATQLSTSGWGDTVMQRVMWMSTQHIRSAEIQLDPPELGSLLVKINTQNDQTTVSFTSAHGSVRDALDQSLPRLREMMEEKGLVLADVDVSDHSRQDKADNGEETETDSDRLANTEESLEGPAPANSQQQAQQANRVGLLDAYA